MWQMLNESSPSAQLQIIQIGYKLALWWCEWKLGGGGGLETVGLYLSVKQVQTSAIGCFV